MSGKSSSASAPKLRTVIFDVDGTLVDSEAAGHRVAFNAAFQQEGLPFQWDEAEYGRLLLITGGRRRIGSYLIEQGYEDQDALRLATHLHKVKTEIFTQLIAAGQVPARPGAKDLVEQLRSSGIEIAVATTGTREWVIPLLDQCFGLDCFQFILTGSDIPQLKPDPAVYTAALSRIGGNSKEIVALEDSRNGLLACLAADLACVIVYNDYTAQQDFSGALAVFDGFGDSTKDARYIAGPKLKSEPRALTSEVLGELLALSSNTA